MSESLDQPHVQHVAVVVNPIKAGADDAINHTTLACRKAGWPQPRFFGTRADDPGTSMTRDALAWGADVVLAAGGDGTVRTVAEVLAGSGTPLGLIPMGTGNLLARNLEVPLDNLESALRIAIDGEEKQIDMGWMRTGSSPEDLEVAEREAFLDKVVEGIPEVTKAKSGWSRRATARDWLYRRLLDTPVLNVTAAEMGYPPVPPKGDGAGVDCMPKVHPEAAMMGLACIVASGKGCEVPIRTERSDPSVSTAQDDVGGGDSEDATTEQDTRRALQGIFSVRVPFLSPFLHTVTSVLTHD